MRIVNGARAGKLGAIAFLAGAWAAAATLGPDGAGYTANTAATYSFVDVSRTGTRVLAGTAADAVQVRMGFAFQFYNKEYSQACISSSGLVGFGTCVSSRANIGFAGARPPGDAAVAAVFWGNLGFSDSGADAGYYQTLGTAPNRRFVVQWNNAMLGSTGQMVTFQAVFSEGSNAILYQYANVGGAATVGIRDSGAPANARFLEFSSGTPALRNGSAILFSQSAATKVAVTVSANVAGLSFVVDGVSYTASKTFNWALNSSHSLSAASPQSSSTSARYAFVNWSNGGGQTQTVTVTGTATYTANFKTQYPLSVALNPAAGGTVSGAGWYDAGGAATVQATVNAGWTFSQWSGGISSKLNPASFTMTGPLQVVANFVAQQPTLNASVLSRVDAAAGQRQVTFHIANGGAGTAANATISAAAEVVSGGSGTVTLVTVLPVQLGTLAPGASVNTDLVFTWPVAAQRVMITLYYAANSGAYSGSTVLNVIR